MSPVSLEGTLFVLNRTKRATDGSEYPAPWISTVPAMPYQGWHLKSESCSGAVSKQVLICQVFVSAVPLDNRLNSARRQRVLPANPQCTRGDWDRIQCILSPGLPSFCGGPSVDASQYKSCRQVLLFVKYVSDRYAGQRYSLADVPPGGRFAEIVAPKAERAGTTTSAKQAEIGRALVYRILGNGH